MPRGSENYRAVPGEGPRPVLQGLAPQLRFSSVKMALTPERQTTPGTN